MRIRSMSGGSLKDEGLAGRVPCIQGAALVSDRSLGRQVLYLASYGSVKGMLIALDYETDSAEEYEFPKGVTAWRLAQAKDGLVYIAGYASGSLLAFDTASRQFVPMPDTPCLPAAGEPVICDLAEGADGSIYFGTYPDCRLHRYDPTRGTIRTIARLAEDELYLRWLLPLPDGRVLAFVGCHRCRLVEVHPDTGESRVLTPEWLVGPSNWGPLWRVGDYVLHQASDLRGGSAPILAMYDWRTGAFAGSISLQDTPQPVILDGITDALVMGRRGGSLEEIVLSTGERRPLWPKLVLPDLPNLSLRRDASGRLVGSSSRHYWVADPETGMGEVRPLPAQGAYIAALGLEATADGQVWGSFGLGQSIFRVAGAGASAECYGPVVEVGGEVYDLEEKDGSLYMASYVEAVLSRFDPSLPWRPGRDPASNPRELARVDHDQYRPLAGLAWAPDGRLAVGTMAKYGIAGGALAFYDTETGDLEVVRDPIPQQAVTALDGDGRRLCAGTSIHSNGVSAQGSWAHVFLWDQKAGGLAADKEIPGAESVSWVVLLPNDRVLVSAQGTLYLWHCATGELETVVRPGSIGPNGSARSADGDVWMVLNRTLTRYDPTTDDLVSYEVGAGAVSAPIALAPDGTVYARRGLGIVSFRPPG